GLDRCEGEDALATAGGTPALREHGRELSAEVLRCAQDDMFKGGFVEFARSWVPFCSREFWFGADFIRRWPAGVLGWVCFLGGTGGGRAQSKAGSAGLVALRGLAGERSLLEPGAD